MGSTSWDTGNRHKKKTQPFPVFRFRRATPAREDRPASPFTEVPEDLKPKVNPVGHFIQQFINVLLLLVLALALIGLVWAFGYQLIHNPQVIVAWCTDLVNTVQQFIHSLALR